jgi:hypothetical protein
MVASAEATQESPAVGEVPKVDVVASLGTSRAIPSPGTSPPRPPGRPPTHGLYSKAAGSDGKRPVRPLDPSEIGKGSTDASSASLSSSDVTSLSESLLEIADEAAQGFLKIQAAKANLAPDVAKPILDSARLGEKRSKWIAKIVPLCLREWGLDGSVSPTGALVSMMGLWALGVWRAGKAISKLAPPKKDDATAPSAS